MAYNYVVFSLGYAIGSVKNESLTYVRYATFIVAANASFKFLFYLKLYSKILYGLFDIDDIRYLVGERKGTFGTGEERVKGVDERMEGMLWIVYL